MLNLPVPLPAGPQSIEEQQKIADCLKSLDKLIAAHTAKLEALQDHKKGLLQQLFPAEGKTVPELRFPDYTDDWKEENMQAVFTFRQGFQVEVDEQFLVQKKSTIRFIRIIDVTQTTEPPRFVEITDNMHILNKHDLFMIRYGTPGVISIGYEGVIANNLFQLTFKDKKYHYSYFWYYYIQARYNDINELTGSSSMPAISFKALNNLQTQYPLFPEQNKIANIFIKLDELINSSKSTLNILTNHKEGLMQLFPNKKEASL